MGQGEGESGRHPKGKRCAEEAAGAPAQETERAKLSSSRTCTISKTALRNAGEPFLPLRSSGFLGRGTKFLNYKAYNLRPEDLDQRGRRRWPLVSSLYSSIFRLSVLRWMPRS